VPGSLERFVLEYVESVGGIWEEVEPQVYDVMMPESLRRELLLGPVEVARLAFDPEALADHPAAQLMTFGHPSLDRFFALAQAQGHVASVYLPASNLAPHDLRSLVRRCLQLTPGLELEIGQRRVYHFRAALFWFEATYVSDEKEQDIVAIGVERYYGRPARHLEQALRSTDPGSPPSLPYPDAACLPLAQTYALARHELLRSVQVTAHARLAELQGAMRRQMARVSAYFSDLRAELHERQRRAGQDSESVARLLEQEHALEREEQARLAELRQKFSLQVELRLLNLLHVVQPKLKLQLYLTRPKGAPVTVEAIWDPLAQTLEAVPCPACGRPTLNLALNRSGQVGCQSCFVRAGSGPT